MAFRMETIYRKNTIKSHIISIIGNFDISKTLKKTFAKKKIYHKEYESGQISSINQETSLVETSLYPVRNANCFIIIKLFP